MTPIRKLLHGMKPRATPFGTEKRLLRVLGCDGDRTLEFSESDAKTLAEARSLFERSMQAGASAFTGRAGQPLQRIERLEEAGPETLLVPRNVGG
ncbi:MAG: hypothetical protein M0015_04785 [Betaproteobacteria bacterium]|nr:hypothetical protein [Betaproteobacteria bacterium]